MQNDKDLIIRLLEEDIMAYRMFIPFIRGMDADSLENFLQGNNNYQYNVTRKAMFQSLLAKMENYKFIIFWGYNNEYYPYLKELWKNYICMEDLKQLKDDEEKIKNFLESNKIHYSTWPQKIKDEFKECMKYSENTIIYTCKKMYLSLKGATKYILNKLKDFISYLDNMGLVDIKSLAEKVQIDMIRNVLAGGCPLGYSAYMAISKNILKSTGENLFSSATFQYIKNNAKKLFMSKKFIFAESLITVANLLISIKNFYDIKNIASNITLYKKNLDDINLSFQMHITQIDYNKHLESTEDLQKVFENILKKVQNDLKDLENLINKINNDIIECEKKKQQSKIGIVASSILTGVQIGLGLATFGASSAMHFGNAAGNAVSGGFHTYNLLKCSEIMKELNKLLEEANKLKEDIKQKINDLNEAISKLSKEFNDIPIPKYITFI